MCSIKLILEYKVLIINLKVCFLHTLLIFEYKPLLYLFNFKWLSKIEKKYLLQVRHNWLNAHPPNHGWFVHQLRKGLIFELNIREGGTKVICCIRQNHAEVDIL